MSQRSKEGKWIFHLSKMVHGWPLEMHLMLATRMLAPMNLNAFSRKISGHAADLFCWEPPVYATPTHKHKEEPCKKRPSNR
jgi:hypothetical protein